ncbi:MAG: tRNA lysidine(34) synthetase TilS [Gammaproteobacteria bacterium]|nr:tRNA lysidine(34) synthetase TilS [Gammaproteobacteria bacterium]
MAFSHHDLVTKSGGLKDHIQAAGWVVAVSGGLDSMCLLHALVQLKQYVQCPSLRVIHIHHSLQDEADGWQQWVEQKSQEYGVGYTGHKVTLCAQQQKDLGLEAAARNARYRIFEQHLQVGEVLLLGHHADDQTETLLLRLLRGAGVGGLRAMPKQRKLGDGLLFRPLMHVRQADLQGYAQVHDLAWCEDPSNQSKRFDRNYLRHNVLPSLRQRWPALDKRIATVASVMADTQQLLDEVAAADLASVRAQYPHHERLPLAVLLVQSKARRHNLVRYWLALHQVPMPDYATMQRIDNELLYSAIDGQPKLQLVDWCLRRDQHYLVLLPKVEVGDVDTLLWQHNIDSKILASGVIELPTGALILSLNDAHGLALNQGDHLERRFRKGGERCRPLGRVHSQSLKKLLQEANVPVWERDQLPLFYINGELAMVADLWINCGFEAVKNTPAWRWHKAT